MHVMPRVRRLVARRPWVQWFAIAIAGVAVGASVADEMARLDAERASWGERVEVWVAIAETTVGEPIEAEPIEVPIAIVPHGAVHRLQPDAVARQTIGRGETIVDVDVWTPHDASAPPGWLVAPVEESPPSGAAPGEHVRVVSDGFVVATDGIVVGRVDQVTLVAVPEDLAPLLPAASTTTGVTLLRVP